MTTSAWNVLTGRRCAVGIVLYLAEHPPAYTARIAREMGIADHTARTTVRDLERCGLIGEDPAVLCRVRCVTLTDTGRDVADHLQAIRGATQ